MISDEIRNCYLALGEIIHELPPKQAVFVRLIKKCLIKACEDAEQLENCTPLFRIINKNQ